MISAGGSALPCATPSSEPMPSWRMRSWSSTSHSRPYFCGHRAGAFGQRSGRQQVGRFVDQLAREVLRFGEDSSTLDRGFECGSPARRPAKANPSCFASFLDRSCIGPARSRPESRLPPRPRRIRPAAKRHPEPARSSTPFCFRRPDGGARQLAQARRHRTWPRLPPPDERPDASPQAGGLVQHGHLERLAGELSRRRRSPATRSRARFGRGGFLFEHDNHRLLRLPLSNDRAVAD